MEKKNYEDKNKKNIVYNMYAADDQPDNNTDDVHLGNRC